MKAGILHWSASLNLGTRISPSDVARIKSSDTYALVANLYMFLDCGQVSFSLAKYSDPFDPPNQIGLMVMTQDVLDQHFRGDVAAGIAAMKSQIDALAAYINRMGVC